MKSTTAASLEECRIFRTPAVLPPSEATVGRIANRLGIELSEPFLRQTTVSVGELLRPYQRVYDLVEPKPPVKYPRTPGHRPSSDDNPYNAWYIRTDIKGADEGPLGGYSVAIKDNIAVAGVPMMAGSKVMEGYTPEYDATVVTRILDAGGLVAGKAVCESLGGDGSSVTSDTGPVTNPRDPSRTTGGSSSGNAALVASKAVDLAVGGDVAGSIRIPAAWTGIVGMKPTRGLVPYTGVMSMQPTLDHIGPMARTVKDCALLLEVMAGYDNGQDPRQPSVITVPKYSQQLREDLKGRRLGILKEGFHGCQPGVESVVRRAVKLLSLHGADVTEISVPIHLDGAAIWTPIMLEGGYDAMVCKAGHGPGHAGFLSTSMLDHLSRAYKARVNDLSIPMKMMCIAGEYLKEYNNNQFYARAMNLVRTLSSAYDTALETCDVIILPTMPTVAPEMPTPETMLDMAAMLKGTVGMIQNTCPFNATGHPALSTFAGLDHQLPVGLSIVGRMWDDVTVLQVAHAFESVLIAEGLHEYIDKTDLR